MQVLWKLGEGFLKDIVEHFPEPKPHSNTVATILKILIEKGFVASEPQGRNHLYRTIVSKEEYSKRSVNQLVKSYFDDSPVKLVSQFLSESKLSVSELETLLQQIKSHKKPE